MFSCPILYLKMIFESLYYSLGLFWKKFEKFLEYLFCFLFIKTNSSQVSSTFRFRLSDSNLPIYLPNSRLIFKIDWLILQNNYSAKSVTDSFEKHLPHVILEIYYNTSRNNNITFFCYYFWKIRTWQTCSSSIANVVKMFLCTEKCTYGFCALFFLYLGFFLLS